MLQEWLPLVMTVVTVLTLWRVAWWLLVLADRLIRALVAAVARASTEPSARALLLLIGERFPRTAKFFRVRLSPAHFVGLPLTLIALSALYIVVLLGGLVEELLEADELIRFDRGVNALLYSARSEPMVTVFAWLTELGGSAALAAVVIVTTGLLWVHGHGYMIAPLWLTLVGSQMTTYTSKFGFARERPEFLAEISAATPSFPSGHSTGAMAVYGFIAYVLARDLVGMRPRFEVIYWSAVLIALVGFSRMLLSVHYASDVAAGFLVGGFWLLVGFAAAEQLRR